jgi:ATP-dependent DNA helicase 2 subunit 2
MLGDPEKYDTAMTIHVERYPRTMIARPPTASSFVTRADIGGEDITQSSTTVQGDDNADQNDLAQIKTSRVYQIPDETAPNGKREVDKDELAKGYEYGRTAVHISESERNIVDLETLPGMDIIGFIPAENVSILSATMSLRCKLANLSSQYGQFMNMSRSNVIIPSKTSKQDSMALSSFIHALYELNTYAVVRFVAKAGNKPIILLVAPEIGSGFEYLVDVELPFAEDVRKYKFPPLDKVLTVSGKTLTQHRHLPSSDLMIAMSDYVDSMDLSTFGKDEDG